MQPRQNSEARDPTAAGSKTARPSQRQKARIRKIFQKGFKDEEFANVVSEALCDSNCNFLFEIPGVLFEKPLAKAAVIQSCGADGNSCFFIVHDMQKKSTKFLDSNTVGQNILQLTHSYANLLACLHRSEFPSSVH